MLMTFSALHRDFLDGAQAPLQQTLEGKWNDDASYDFLNGTAPSLILYFQILWPSQASAYPPYYIFD